MAIERHRRQPFFLYLPHYTVHTPLQAKEQLIAKYPPAGEFRGQQNNPVYAAMIESLDDGIGRILAKLDEWKLAENTIVIFTSDNGGLATLEGPNTPSTSNAPLREGKGFLYEGGIRVPLIVRWPATVKSGQTSEQIACSVDLLPTLADLCGVKFSHEVDGASLAPMLLGKGEVERDAIYWHYPHYANQGGRPGGAVRAGDWKLIEFYESGRQELFNLKTDLRESRNLTAQQPERVRELAAKLATWRQMVGAQMMMPNPTYRPNPQAADGTITLPARTADVHGEQLRFEPLPHRNTLGYWTNSSDQASFEFEVERPGAFNVELLAGCGRGSGGSVVEVATGDEKSFLRLRKPRVPRISAEKHWPRNAEQSREASAGGSSHVQADPAVMDLRQVRLLPAS
jgi:arylsulfatase A